MRAAQFPSRRKLLTGAAALAAYAALGIDEASAADPLVQFDQVSSATSIPSTGNKDWTGVNLIVLGQGLYNPPGYDNGQDSQGNTYTSAGFLVTGDGNFVGALSYCYNPSVSASMHFTSAGSYGTLAVLGFKFSAASPLDGSGTSATSASATALQPGSKTPSQANNLLVSMIMTPDTSAGGTYAVDSGFVLGAGNQPLASNYQGAYLAYKWQNATTAQNPTWSGWSGAGDAVALQAAFKMTSGPSGGLASPSLTTLGVGP